LGNASAELSRRGPGKGGDPLGVCSNTACRESEDIGVGDDARRGNPKKALGLALTLMEYAVPQDHFTRD